MATALCSHTTTTPTTTTPTTTKSNILTTQQHAPTVLIALQDSLFLDFESL
jgi:hypothetical protein